MSQNGKGDKRRPSDSKKYRRNWDKIFKPKPNKELKSNKDK